MSKTIYTERTVDHWTKEVTETKTISKTAKSKEDFVIWYMEHIGTMAKLPYYELKTMICLAPHIDWDTGNIGINPFVQQSIEKCSGLKYSSIRSAISRLAKRNFIKKIKYNWYRINPEIFWKGKEGERLKQFNLVYKWDIVEDTKVLLVDKVNEVETVNN